MICPHGHDEGMVERLATPEEVDAGAELGIAFDPCPKCAGMSVFAEPFQTITSASYERITRGPDGSEIREAWDRQPDGSYARRVEPDTLLGVPDYDHQAETGQGPPAR